MSIDNIDFLASRLIFSITPSARFGADVRKPATPQKTRPHAKSREPQPKRGKNKKNCFLNYYGLLTTIFSFLRKFRTLGCERGAYGKIFLHIWDQLMKHYHPVYPISLERGTLKLNDTDSFFPPIIHIHSIIFEFFITLL